MKNFLLAFRNLRRNIRRTVAIILTVAMGAGALFCFEGFILGVQEDYKDSTIRSHYGNGQINTTGYREQVYEEPWKHWIGNYGEVEDYLYSQEGVEYVFPRVSVSGMIIHKKVSLTGMGQGILPQEEEEFFHSLKLESGESLGNKKNAILLGKGLAAALDAKPGSEVKVYTKDVRNKVRSKKFIVSGIFETGMSEYDNRAFRIPLSAAQELIRTRKIETVSLGLSDHKHWEKIASGVEDLYPELEATSFAVLDKIWYQHSMDWLNAQYRVVQVIILSIVLLGIFNTISSAVLERKQEIGNLRANGESTMEVIRLIVYEGFFLGLLGGIVGLSLSYAAAKGFLHEGILMPPGPGQTKQFFIKFSFEWEMALSVLSLSLFSSTFASLLAALKVARMPIAKALRSY